MYESILSYRRYLYLKLAAGLVGFALLLYLRHDSAEPPNGGTWLGYTLGGIGLGLILFLLWFGVRKRQYHRTAHGLAGWASAHVYMGMAVLVIVSLHCGFQFGWNVHTLAYTLLVLVVLSGFWGLYSYLACPPAVTANRNGLSRDGMMTEIARLDDTCLALAVDLDEAIHHRVLLAVETTRLGGTFWQQLTAGLMLPVVPPNPLAVAGFDAPVLDSFAADAVFILNRYVQGIEQVHQVCVAAELAEALAHRQELVVRAQRDIRYHAAMKCWLFLHVPLSCALLAAVLVHVVSVFFYW